MARFGREVMKGDGAKGYRIHWRRMRSSMAQFKPEDSVMYGFEGSQVRTSQYL